MFFIILFFISGSVFSESMIEEILSKRYDFYILHTSQEALTRIHEYRNALEHTAIGEEDKLSIENILLIEEMNFSGDDEETGKRLYLALHEQKLKNDLFTKDKRPANLSLVFLVSWANIRVRTLAYLPPGQMYRESMAAQELYLSAIRKNRRSPYALMNYAMWLYFAPPIAGGGYENALKTMSQALKYSRDDKEKYFILVYRSQIFFAMNRKNECLTDLNNAHVLFPHETFTAIVKERNEKNKALFD
jgi:hypothetical protein